MPVFYERTETKDRIIIQYKNSILYFGLYAFMIVAAAVTLLMGFVVPEIFCIMVPAVIAVLFLLSFSMRDINPEIKDAMKKKTAKISGSRFSVSEPLTIEISKEKATQEPL